MWSEAEEESVKSRDNIAITVRALLLVLAILAMFAFAAQASVRVATNKYVILDDPIIKRLNGTGFADPKYSYGAWSYWNGIGQNTRRQG